jgi:hypothetical protein
MITPSDIQLRVLQVRNSSKSSDIFKYTCTNFDFSTAKVLHQQHACTCFDSAPDFCINPERVTSAGRSVSASELQQRNWQADTVKTYGRILNSRCRCSSLRCSCCHCCNVVKQCFVTSTIQWHELRHHAMWLEW